MGSKYEICYRTQQNNAGSQFLAEKERWEDIRANEFQMAGNWFGKTSGEHETH